LGDGDALDGEEFLGIGGLVERDGAISELGDLLDVFEAGDGVSGGGEAVFAGVLGGTGFAIGGARAGRIGGVGAIGCELFGGKRCFESSAYNTPRLQGRMGVGLSLKCGRG
jgi:hypothetical protein